MTSPGDSRRGPSRTGRAALAGALLCLAAGSLGCGYRFAVGELGLPPGVGAVYVPVFANRSSEGEAGAIFTEAFADALARSGRVGGPGAPTVLEGTVIFVTSAPVATQRDGQGVGVYQVRARLRLLLVEGSATLCTREIEGGEDYLPSVDLLGLDAARGQALRRLAARLMEQASRDLCFG